jgi:hypothetical protein
MGEFLSKIEYRGEFPTKSELRGFFLRNVLVSIFFNTLLNRWSLHFNMYGRRRRYRSPGRSTLSTRSIFSNKGSRSQANQIHSLRKYISSVARRTRPEKKVLHGTPASIDFQEPAETTYTAVGIDFPDPGREDNERIGDAIRVLSFKLYLSFTIYPGNEISPGASIRVIILQMKVGTDIPTLQELLLYNYSAQGDAGYNLTPRSPFINGASANLRICFDRTFKANITRNQSTFKCHAYRFHPILRVPDNSNPPQNLFAYYLIPSGIGLNEHVLATHSWKLVFTDA